MKLAVGFTTFSEQSAKYLADFLPSLMKALEFLAPDDYQVYAWDNSPAGDNEDRIILEAYPAVKYFGVGENLGFGRASNIMIRQANQAGAEYFLVLNPDMVLEPSAIKELVGALDKDRDKAAAAPKILRWNFAANTKTKQIDSVGIVLKTGLRFQDLGQGAEDQNQFDRRQILGPSGAAGLFRLSALEKIKEGDQYFDERFFMYKEDCDLNYRLYRAGLKACLVPEAIIYHDRTAFASGAGLWSSLKNRAKKSRQVRLWSHLNEHLIYVKHWSNQNFISRVFIVIRIASIFIFSLIFEQFLLKNYRRVFK